MHTYAHATQFIHCVIGTFEAGRPASLRHSQAVTDLLGMSMNITIFRKRAFILINAFPNYLFEFCRYANFSTCLWTCHILCEEHI
jgi:hypothetical protein